MDEQRQDRSRTASAPSGRGPRTFAVLAAVLALALGGVAAAGCGDDEEGPAEEAGKVVDEAGQEGAEAVEEADKEVGGKE